MPTTAQAKPWTRILVMAALIGLFAFSLHLALSRIYQVDEAQNLFTARILASRWESRYNLWIEIWHLWPLAWLATWCRDATGLAHAGRLFMLAVFWINILLTAINCGLPFRSRQFLWAFIGAATLTPLWDYGFEIRHDNLLLLLLLLFLRCLRTRGRNVLMATFTLGSLAAVMQFVTFKGFVYWVPMAALVLAFPPRHWVATRWKIALAGLLGFVTTAGILVGLLALSGHLSPFMDDLAVLFDIASKNPRQGGLGSTLARLVLQTPLVTAVAAAAIAHTLVAGRGRWREQCPWEGVLPEAILVLVTILALLVHPFPLPYHLCLTVPFAFILGVRWFDQGWASSGSVPARLWLWGSLVTVTHLLPFAMATSRHLDYPNDRQEKLMKLAEEMTDSVKDPVFDAAGLVSSRNSIGRQWFLHTTFLEKFSRGDVPPVHKMLEEHPAAVLIPNYRFGWFTKDDVKFIQSHYLPLAGDFWVLGQSMKGSDHHFACVHPGNYSIAVRRPGPGPGPTEVTLDGRKIPVPSVQQLMPGNRTLQSEDGVEIQVTWTGPRLAAVPDLGEGSANHFFINWY